MSRLGGVKLIVFIIFQIVVISILVIWSACYFVLVNKRNHAVYEIVDLYIIDKGTAIFYKQYRHEKIYLDRMSYMKPINFYLSSDGYELETVSETLLDKELTILDKDVLVIKIENINQEKIMLSYHVKKLSQEHLEFLMRLSIGQKVELGTLVSEKSEDILSCGIVLKNNFI